MLIDIIYTVVLLLGATFFYYGITQFQKSYTLKKEGVRVKATVVDFQTHSNKGSTMYTPVFNFKTPQGKEMTVVSAVSSHPKPYEINEKVMLIYEKNKPENAKPIGFWSIYLLPFILLTFAFPLLFIGLGRFLFQWNYI